MANSTAGTQYKYIYPYNARQQDQLDIMLAMEAADQDPLDEDVIDQEIIKKTEYWHISANRFPYAGAERQFLIVSRLPIYRIEDMSDAMWLDLKQVWLDLKQEYGLSGGGFSFRFGDPARSGASLTRLHAHLIMPTPGEKVKVSIGGRTELHEGLHLA